MKSILEINKDNPNAGVKYENYIRIDDNGKKQCKLYSWMLKDKSQECIWVPQRQLDHFIKKLCIDGLNTQIYFDIIVLGLTDESQRPKCRICGKELEFIGIGHGGYPATCSKECHKELKRLDYLKNPKMMKKGGKHSQETLQKISIASKNTKAWENPEWRKKHSEYMKAFAQTPEGKAFYKHTAEKAAEANIRRALDANKPASMYDSKLYHKGVYHSNVYNRDFPYDSGWELEFIKYMETDIIKAKIKIFDRSRVAIPYKWDDGSSHKYLPDFYIMFDSGIKIVIEIKPNYLLTLDRKVALKVQAGKDYFSKKNIQYLVLTEKEMLSNNKIKSKFNLLDFIHTLN